MIDLDDGDPKETVCSKSDGPEFTNTEFHDDVHKKTYGRQHIVTNCHVWSTVLQPAARRSNETELS